MLGRDIKDIKTFQLYLFKKSIIKEIRQLMNIVLTNYIVEKNVYSKCFMSLI